MTLRYSQQKIEAALQLLEEFEATPFPHRDSTIAIGRLKKLLQVTASKIVAPISPTLLAQTEMEATALISEILELLGIISNSANVRNSFEIHGPVLALASTLLADKKAALIISFEWDYIPYTYPQSHPFLPSFVIIGLPASEASNALVLPAIGHELGHSLWLRDKFKDVFEPEINKEIVDCIKGPMKAAYEAIFGRFGIRAEDCDEYKNLFTWAKAAEDARRQAEELFSDFTGLFLFGTSYVDTFEYLLSPALSTERDPEYPSVWLRARHLLDNAAKIGVSVPVDFTARFETQASPFRLGSNDQLQIDLADAASMALATTIADRVFAHCKARGIATPGNHETNSILDDFRVGVPAQRTSGVGAILNAGWAAFKDPDIMKERSDADRLLVINELILKSIEIYEIERLTPRGPQKKRITAGA